MRLLDRYLRARRIAMAAPYLPIGARRVLDIGCDDGFLLRRLPPGPRALQGIDPRLAADGGEGLTLGKGCFPQDLGRLGLAGPYDAVFALAVFEHFDEGGLRQAADAVPGLLSPGGRLIITVPHPWVDAILDVLIALRLLDGTAAEEHHGFDPRALPSLFPGLTLAAHRRFQLGLNNLYVFEKAP
jgi:SAM-dependent methyltransferase